MTRWLLSSARLAILGGGAVGVEDNLGIGPTALQVVEHPLLLEEHVDYHGAVVDEDPASLVAALDAEFFDSRGIQAVLNLLGDVLGLHARGSAGYHEVVADRGQGGDVEHQHVVGFAINRRVGGILGYFKTFQTGYVSFLFWRIQGAGLSLLVAARGSFAGRRLEIELMIHNILVHRLRDQIPNGSPPGYPPA